MFCNNCGTKLPDQADFCYNCGARIPKAAPRPAAPRPATQPPVKTKKRGGFGWFLVIVILALAAYCNANDQTIFDLLGGEPTASAPQLSTMEQLEQALEAEEKVIKLYKRDWNDGDGRWLDVVAILQDRINTTPQMYHIDWANISIMRYNQGREDEHLELTMTYFSDISQRKFDKAVEEILSEIPDDADDWEKALLVHDALCRRVEYKDGKHDQTAYGALVLGEAVCNGYAMAYEYLLTELDIPCDTVVGYADALSGSLADNPMYDATAHAWNIVTFGRESYYVDVTWDDLGEQNAFGQDYISREWFCVNQKDIDGEGRSEIDGVYDLSQWDLDNEDRNYYVYTDSMVDEYDYETVKEILARQLDQGQTMLSFRMSDMEVHYDARYALTELGDLSKLIQELGLEDCAYQFSYEYTGTGMLCLHLFPNYAGDQEQE